jgi:hypothetical protein
MSERASLRLQWEGSTVVETCRVPFVQSGRLTAVVQDDAGEAVVMRVGPKTLAFFVADFAELFQGHDHAQRLLRDAVEHQDFVEIRVLPERLSYHNAAQYARAVNA